jgi:ribA/ribD-fused uncharacterized protein
MKRLTRRLDRKGKAENIPAAGGIGEIHFYRANEKPYGAFSNLFRRPMTFEGREYPTAEHAYQAGKASKERVREWLLGAPTPSLLAMAAHGLYSWDVVSNWTQIKYDRMRRVLLAKFSQYADLMELLLSTGDARLVETGRVDNAVNRTWGEVNGKGRNMLGILLMEVRAKLRQNCACKAAVPGSSKRKATGRGAKIGRLPRFGTGKQTESTNHVKFTLQH